MVRERENLPGIAQVQGGDPQPVPPPLGVGGRGEPTHRVLGEAAGHGEFGAVPKKHQRDLVADLDAPAGQQRTTTGEVGAGRAAGEVLVGAFGTQQVVEVVYLPVVVLADVAALRAVQQR